MKSDRHGPDHPGMENNSLLSLNKYNYNKFLHVEIKYKVILFDSNLHTPPFCKLARTNFANRSFTGLGGKPGHAATATADSPNTDIL
jgi:hypothetical protein